MTVFQNNIDSVKTSFVLEKNKIAEQIKKFGRPSASILHDSQCSIFTTPSIDGFIGYRLKSNCAVVISDPVCKQRDMPELARAFHDYCKMKGWNTIYMLASQKFASWAIKNVCSASIQVGEEFIVDPKNNPEDGQRGRKLRWHINGARKARVVVNELIGRDEQIESAIKEVEKTWLKSRKGPQIYLNSVDLFSNRIGKRWFYAKQDDKIVGVLSLNRIESCQGWVLNVLMATPEAPKGTTELLVIQAIDVLRNEDCHFVSLGGGPQDQLGEIVGFGRFTSMMARGLFRMASWFFKLNARKKYLKKFSPKCEPFYILFGESKIGVKELLALRKALNISI